MKTQPINPQEFQTASSVTATEGSIRYSEIIIGFYLLGVKPPWIMRVFTTRLCV